MSKFACLCGNVLSLSNGWSDYELLLVRQGVIEHIADGIEEGALRTAEAFYSEIDQGKVAVYKCDTCGRIHLEGEGGFRSYVPESLGDKE